MNQYTTQNTEVKVGPSKVEVFMKKAISFARRSYEAIPTILRGTCRFMFNLCCSIMRVATRLSIILIALIMLYTFIESHPSEWANFVKFFQSIGETFKTASSNAMNLLRF